jgi:cytochrome c553
VKKILLAIAASIVALSLLATSAHATPAKAKATGKKCSECHKEKGPKGPI